MTNLFLQILNASVTASWLIGAVVLVRFVVKRTAPRWIVCLLWGLVAVRLVLPFEVESSFSLVPETPKITLEVSEESVEVSAEPEISLQAPPVEQLGNTSRPAEEISHDSTPEESIPEESTEESAPEISTPEESTEENVPETSIEESLEESVEESTEESAEESVEVSAEESIPTIIGGTTNPPSAGDSGISAATVAGIVWLCGLVALAVYATVNYLLLKKQVAIFVPDERGFRRCEAIDTPFVLGFFRPRIYLPYGLSSAYEPYILAHEQAHIRRLDHLIKPIAYFILAIHWFNPLVWLSFVLFCKDIEYACDEKVLENAAADIRKDYAFALLECASKRSFLAASPIAFGEVSVKNRVKTTMSYKKPFLWMMILCIILCAVVAVLFCTSPADTEDTSSQEQSTENVSETLSEEQSTESETANNSSADEPEISEDESEPEISEDESQPEISDDVSEEVSEPEIDDETSADQGESNVPDEEPTASKGLSLWPNKAGDGYVVCGTGDCYDTDVVIPAYYNGMAVVEIAGGAFRNCEIESVVIPSTVTKIGERAFENCKSLRKVTMTALNQWFAPNQARSVFGGCEDLTLILFPGSEKTVYGYSFYHCSELSHVVLMDGFETIDFHAFRDCTSLQSVVIPEGVKTIKALAFNNCIKLQRISIPDSVTFIGDDAFGKCSDATSIEIGSGLQEIDGVPFVGSYKVEYIEVDKKNPYYYSEGNCLIETQSKHLLKGCNNSVIPDGVTVIVGNAFNMCFKLKKIVLPDTVTEIGDYAFYRCTKLEEIVLSKNLVKIGDYGFSNCTSLKNIELPDSLTKIGTYSFSCCKSLTSLVIPKNVTEIPMGAFSECIYLENVVLHDEIKKLTGFSFERCLSLKSITLPGSIGRVGGGLFAGCTDLQSVVIGEGITSIESRAFLGCTSLTHVSIPNTVKTIGLRAFEECSALENISIPESVIEIGGYAFYNCTGIKTLILPDTLIYVEEGIFKGWTPEQTIFIERVTPSYSWTYYLVTDAKIYWGNEWEYVDGVPVPQE